MYCCPGRPPSSTRSKPLVIENILVPLVDNEKFRALEQAIQPPYRSGTHGSIAHAVLVGRFFAGRKDRSPGDRWSGYGHMGCCSLLAIQEVLSVDPQNRDDLDYGASSDQPEIGGKCGDRDMIGSRSIQRDNRGSTQRRSWRAVLGFWRSRASRFRRIGGSSQVTFGLNQNDENAEDRTGSPCLSMEA